MASFRRRNDKWQAQIRRAGNKPISKTFLYKHDAEAWARSTEHKIDTGSLLIDTSILKTTPLLHLFVRYRDTVTTKKRRCKIEQYCINAFLRHPIAQLKLIQVTPNAFATYRDHRLKSVKPSTIAREFTIYRHIFQVAIDEWGYPIQTNPILKVRLPSYDDRRTRRLAEGELETIERYCIDFKQCELHNCIIVAIETGMRRGELLRIKRNHYNKRQRTLLIPITKNEYPRIIPLTSRAEGIIVALTGEQKLYSKSSSGFASAWVRMINKTGIDDLRFHDLRHEAISRFFEMGLSIPEVALISGHRDYRMLQRYTHLKPEQVALKLK